MRRLFPPLTALPGPGLWTPQRMSRSGARTRTASNFRNPAPDGSPFCTQSCNPPLDAPRRQPLHGPHSPPICASGSLLGAAPRRRMHRVALQIASVGVPPVPTLGAGGWAGCARWQQSRQRRALCLLVDRWSRWQIVRHPGCLFRIHAHDRASIGSAWYLCACSTDRFW